MSRKTLALVLAALAAACSGAAQTRITFPSEDGVVCTADVYLAKQDKTAPFLVLFHQAGYSRGEYLDIAPRLNLLGFNCMAVDARSGSQAKGVDNETNAAASAAGKATGKYIDALPDLIAALKYARKTYAEGKLVAWGSSYSASMAIHIAGAYPGLVDGVVAFSPGEYFTGAKSSQWIAEGAAKITALPVFITSGPDEEGYWRKIYDAMPTPRKASYLPSATASLHGSSALWTNRGSKDHPIPNPLAEGYWAATGAFLKQHFLP